MANFNDRLTLIEKMIGRMNERLTDIESALWEDPLVDENDDSVEPIDPSDAIEQLKLRLNQVQTEIANLNPPGANVIQFADYIVVH
jgi:hypothetical protein